VPTSAAWAPRRCVAAIDFGRSSITAALAAMELLEAPAEIVLAFVHESEDEPPDADVLPRHTRLLLESLPHTLTAPAGVTTTSVVLRGSVLPTLLEFTRRCAADLLSFGRHGRSSSPGVIAAPVGPTVRGLLEGAPCSALISSAP
jgi:hypothetical protein